MSKRRGLPTESHMRHDSHFVDSLSERFGPSLGRQIPIDEIITTAGARHVLVRSLQRHPDLVLVALLEKHRTNLALARFQLLEVERSLP